MTWGKTDISITRCTAADVSFARALMRQVNRELAPDTHVAEFEAYIEAALQREYSDLLGYFAAEKGNGFWILRQGESPAGTFGLERLSPGTVELRRMYLATPFRRRGLGTIMLAHAEHEAEAMGYATMVAWTSELQQAAISFYASSGFTLAEQKVEGDSSAKTVGSGFVRYRFEKPLLPEPPRSRQPSSPGG